MASDQLSHTNEISAPSDNKPKITMGGVFWLLWALMPLPLVWVAFYLLHSFLIALVLYGGVVCALPLMWHFLRRPDFSKSLLTLTFSVDIVWKVVLGILLTWLVVGGGWFIFRADLLQWDTFPMASSSLGIKQGVAFWILATYFVLINPIVEECFWRGVIYERMKMSTNETVALWVSSALFGGWHWIIIQYFFQPHWHFFLTLMVCLGGVLFARAYETHRSIWPSILVHGIGADLMIMVMLWDALHSG